MSHLQLFQSTTMPFSASDYFIICETQQRF